MRQMERGTLYENSGSAPWNFFKILYIERGQGFKNYSNGFYEKKIFPDK